MGLMLPKLTRDVDCEPLGYPGIVLTLWLNVDDQEWQPPKVLEGETANPWDRVGYWMYARMVERVVIPGTYTTDGEDVVYDVPDRQAAYTLLNQVEGFDPNILVWAVEAWRQKRAEWLASEVKN